MEAVEMIFFMEQRHKTELHPERKIPGSEADLYKTTQNDNRNYTQNTTSRD